MNRIKRMRTLLNEALVARGTPGDWCVTHGLNVCAARTAQPSALGRSLVKLHGGAGRTVVASLSVLIAKSVCRRTSPHCRSHVTSQIGMFSYTGLSKSQSERMVEEFHIYMLNSGRINVAGLNEASIPILADAIHAVVTGGK